MKHIIILGSARINGETKKIVSDLINLSNWDLVDLNEYNIAHFNYENQYENDDFIKLIQNIIDNYNVIIFATPVYWYSMSGRMKVFFDRLTDLLIFQKEIGRKLKGKSIAVITSSGGDNLGSDFWIPFEKTAEYLGMNFITGLHTLNTHNNDDKLNDFIKQVDKTN